MTTRKIPLSHSDYWCLQAQETRLAAQEDPEARERMNMTGSPPATESGKPGCPLLDKTSHRQLRHVGNSWEHDIDQKN